MEDAAPHLRSRNTVRKMIPQFMTSLSPLPLSFWSFSLLLSLWFSTFLACAQSEQCQWECETTTVAGKNLSGNCETKCPPGVTPPSHEDPFKRHVDGQFEQKRKGDHLETHTSKPKEKRRRLQDESKYGDREESDISVNVGLEIAEDGRENVMEIERKSTPSEGDDEVERAKQMTQNAAMLLVHAEMLQDMGQKLLAQSRALLRSTLQKSVHDSQESTGHSC